MGDQGLLLRQAQTHRGQDLRDLLPQGLRVRSAAFDHQAPIIGIPDQLEVRQAVPQTLGLLCLAGRRTTRRPCNVLVQDGQRDITEQWRENRPLRGSGGGGPQQAVLAEDARFEERLHQGQDAFVSDTCPHPVHEGRVRDFVEAGFDVSFHDPLVTAWFRGQVTDLRHRVVSPAPRAEPIGTGEEIRLEDRLQHQLQRCLDHPVGDGRDPQAAQLAARLGDHPLPHRQRPETTVLQRSPQPVEVVGHPDPRHDRRGGAPVHPGGLGTLVAPHPIPRHQQKRGIGHQIEQVIELATGILTRPPVQLGLDLQYPAFGLEQGVFQFIGIHRRQTSWPSTIHRC